MTLYEIMYSNITPSAIEYSEWLRSKLPLPRRKIAPFQWYGGKGLLAHWIMEYLPPAKIYVEPFAGGASILFNTNTPYPIEVLNDLNGDVVNVFRILQDRDKFQILAHKLTWTPYSRSEYAKAIDLSKEEDVSDIDRAWAFMVKHNQGFAGLALRASNWSRTTTVASGQATNTNNWRRRMSMLEWWHKRLRRVQIDCRDALDVIQYWDSEDTLFYMDPPYVPEERTDPKVYDVETDSDFHTRLITLLLNVQGKVVLSGYPSPIYTPLEDHGWEKIEREVVAYSSNAKVLPGGKRNTRIEALWLSPGIRNVSQLSLPEF